MSASLSTLRCHRRLRVGWAGERSPSPATRLAGVACLALLVGVTELPARAQTTVYPTPAAAVAAAFPGQQLDEWEATDSDFNGDGYTDRAMLLTHTPATGGLETRLVVLAGGPGGSYAPLSFSAPYCQAQKFFGLRAAGPHLWVTAVHHLDSDGLSNETLQFRFDKQRGDLVLIGQESLSESFQDRSYHRHSVNLAAGTDKVYQRIRGRITVTAHSRFAVRPLERLQGFDCEKDR